MKKILLYSGGMDSWLISKLWKPDEKIYINLHTNYSEDEINRLEDDVKIVDFSFLNQFEIKDNGVIPLRNLYLIMIACNLTGFEDVEICLGATNGDRIHDKTLKFANLMNELLNYLYDGEQNCLDNHKKININFKYKNYSKYDLLKEYVDNGGDIEEAMNKSFSCQHPKSNGEPCWKCKPCFRKYVAFKKLDYKFNKEIDDRMLNYISNHLIHKIHKGNHNRGIEDKDTIDVYNKYCIKE